MSYGQILCSSSSGVPLCSNSSGRILYESFHRAHFHIWVEFDDDLDLCGWSYIPTGTGNVGWNHASTVNENITAAGVTWNLCLSWIKDTTTGGVEDIYIDCSADASWQMQFAVAANWYESESPQQVTFYCEDDYGNVVARTVVPSTNTHARAERTDPFVTFKLTSDGRVQP